MGIWVEAGRGLGLKRGDSTCAQTHTHTHTLTHTETGKHRPQARTWNCSKVRSGMTWGSPPLSWL